MSTSGQFLNNKYAVVLGIAGGIWLTHEYDNTLLTVFACIIFVLFLAVVLNKILY